jgi:hypothetical protein
MALLEKAAATGFERARGELAQLGYATAFDPASWLAAPAAHMQFDSPRVGVIRGFLAPEICAWLIERGRPKLKASLIGDPHSGEHRASTGRTNTGAYLPLRDSDVIVQLVRARIAAALGMPMTHQEAPNILHYEVGQTFAPHYDFMAPDLPGYAEDLAANGQRAATFLVYLNGDFDGGETQFLDLDWKFKGRTGDALFFWNVSSDGAVERKLLHAGAAPTRGEKWLLSQWVRDRPVSAI